MKKAKIKSPVVKVQVRLDNDLIGLLNHIARGANTDPGTVAGVLLAMFVMREDNAILRAAHEIASSKPAKVEVGT